MLIAVAPLVVRLSIAPAIVLGLVIVPGLVWAWADRRRDEMDAPEDAPNADWLVPMP